MWWYLLKDNKKCKKVKNDNNGYWYDYYNNGCVVYVREYI